MKIRERDQARSLRKQGRSISEIVLELGAAKSSVSLWVRDMSLTTAQKRRLSQKGHTFEVVERRRIARLSHEKARRAVVFNAAKESIQKLTERELFYLGLGLYWGEGSKTQRGSVSFFNGDPRLIQIMMRFYEEICGVSHSKFKGHILLHHHLSARRAERYWSKVTGLPLSQFQKTSLQHNKRSKNMKDTLPFGTFALCVYDTSLFLMIMGWMEGSYGHIVPKSNYLPPTNERYL